MCIGKHITSLKINHCVISKRECDIQKFIKKIPYKIK